MEYQVTLLTVSQPIPTGSSGTASLQPWANSSLPITFNNPQLSEVAISDDDPEFESGFYTPSETQQTLVNDTTFGYGASSTVLTAGTQMSNFIGSVLEDQDGHKFVAIFPRVFQSGSYGTEVGGRTSVMILPLGETDEEGNTTYPSFSLANTYHYAGTNVITSSQDGVAYAPADVQCFVEGTRIRTQFGDRPIEKLRAGDMIKTRDNGMRWLSWIGHTRLSPTDFDLRPNLRPILIRAGALAPGLPQRDLMVSPQHRVMVRSAVARRMFGHDEILVAAKHLLSLPGIDVVAPQADVIYWHMLFDGHEIVMSEGAWTESFYTGPHAIKSMSESARREIFALFPELAQEGYVPASARKLLNGREGRKLAERHARNARCLVEDLPAAQTTCPARYEA